MRNFRIKPVWFFSTLLMMGAMQSCTHYYYGPNSNNIPLLTQKNDFKISAGVSTADETSGFEMQSAVAISDHLGAMFNFYSAGGKDNTSSGSSSSTIEKGNGTLTEIGLGYYSPLKDKHWIFELYGGFGGGSVNNTHYQNETSKVGLTRLFLQPSIGYVNEARTFEAALSTKLSSVSFKVKESRVVAANNQFDFDQLTDLRNNSNVVFFEPSIMVRGGFPHVKLQLQITSSDALKQKQFYTQGVNFSTSVLFTINAKK